MATKSTHRWGRPFVDGTWVSGDEIVEVTDLSTGTSFAAIETANADRATAAVAAADRATEAMAAATVPERADWLRSIAAGIRARADELAETIVREAGKPISSARGEVESAAERFDRAVEEIRGLHGEYRRGTTGGHEGWEAIVRPEPRGVVLCIAPYNYPLSTTALQVAPAIAAGNAVVLKPASATPLSGAILTEIVREAGLPDGGFNYVPGRGSEIGDALAGDDRIDAIALTGSAEAGERVARSSGTVELHMELGGNAPAVVLEDADLHAAARAISKGALKYAGQRCSAVSRVLAHEAVHDDLVDLLDGAMDDWQVGDLFEESTGVGPLIDEDQADWVCTLVDDAVDRGATLVRGGDREGRVFEPALLADVPHGARIVDEEQFGPVVPVARVSDADEAVALANRSDLALDAAVFTADYDRAMDLADRIEAGAVRINGAPSHGLGDLPFGGRDRSGIGREGLGTTIEAFVETKTIVL